MNTWFVYRYAFNFTLELLISLVCFVVHLPRRRQFPQRLALSLLLYMGGTFALWGLIQLIPIVIPLTPYWILCCVLLVCSVMISFQIGIWGAVYAVTGAYVTQHLTYRLVSILGLYIDTNGSVPALLFFSFGLFAVVSLLLGIFVISKERLNEICDHADARRILIFVAMLAVCVVLSNSFGDQTRLEVPDMNTVTLIVNLYGTVCCLLLLWLQFGFNRSDRQRNEQRMLENMLHYEQERNSSVQEAIEEIHILSHDMKQQIRYLEARVCDEEGRSVLAEMKEKLAAYSRTVNTGSEALDYVFMEKLLLVHRHGITFSYMVDGKQLDFMSTLDMVTMVGNALDNAIEYLSRVEDPARRLLSMRVQGKNGGVFVHIENYCEHAPLFRDGVPVTTKDGPYFHGYGTRSIRHIVNQYDGVMHFTVQDQTFAIDIFFPHDK